MADANTQVSLADFHTAVVSDIHAAFPDLATVQFYREEDDRKPLAESDLPACLLQVTEFETVPEEDGGTGQLPVQMRCEARLVLSFKTPAAKLAIRTLAAAFAAWMRKRRFTNPNDTAKKLPTGAAEVVGAYADDFSPELDQFEVWRVEWLQGADLGATVWGPGDAPPTVVLASFSPAVGTPHVGAYQVIFSPAAP